VPTISTKITDKGVIQQAGSPPTFSVEIPLSGNSNIFANSSSDIPRPLAATALPGTGSSAARSDHVHPLPTGAAYTVLAAPQNASGALTPTLLDAAYIQTGTLAGEHGGLGAALTQLAWPWFCVVLRPNGTDGDVFYAMTGSATQTVDATNKAYIPIPMGMGHMQDIFLAGAGLTSPQTATITIKGATSYGSSVSAFDTPHSNVVNSASPLVHNAALYGLTIGGVTASFAVIEAVLSGSIKGAIQVSAGIRP
jgi:hypothetical protein